MLKSPESTLAQEMEAFKKEKQAKETLKSMSPEELKNKIKDYEVIVGLGDNLSIETDVERQAMSKRRIALKLLGDKGLDIIEGHMKTYNGKIVGFADLESIMMDLEEEIEKSKDKKQIEELKVRYARARKLLDSLSRWLENEKEREDAQFLIEESEDKSL